MAKKKSATAVRKKALEQARKKRKRQLTLIGGLTGVFALFVAVYMLVQQNNPTPEAKLAELPIAAEIGSVAPDFELPAHTGGTVSLSDFRGQPVAVTFMHTW